MSYLFHQIFFLPLYNGLIWLSGVVPGADLGLAIVILTLLVKFLLFPLQHKMSKTQLALKKLEPQLAGLKEKYKDNRNEHAKQMMALYREHGVNPFAGFLVLIIQLPILIALFWVFKDSFVLNREFIYSFVSHPEALNTQFLGFLDITGRNYYLAVLVGVTQFFQMRLALPPQNKTGDSAPSFQADFSRSLNLQMRYFMPAMVIFIAATLPAAVPLYWLTSNLFAIVHEAFVRRKAGKMLEK